MRIVRTGKHPIAKDRAASSDSNKQQIRSKTKALTSPHPQSFDLKIERSW